MSRLSRLAYLTLIGVVMVVVVLASSGGRLRADLDQEDTDDVDAPLPWRSGPQQIALGHGVRLALPDGYQFLGLPHADRLMTQLGNLNNENLLGLVVSSERPAEGADDGYLISLRYEAEGYIKDDETLDADAILKVFRDAEHDYNAQRKKAGFPAIHARAWREPPRYDKQRHELVWALLVSSQDDEPGEDPTVNYNTRVLGRKGYVSINLVTEARLLARYKPAARAILAATGFGEGLRYEDFDSRTDKVAQYGLTGLVLGGLGLGVAKLVKVGLLAKFGQLILAGLIAAKKLAAALLLAAAAGVRKLLGRRKRDAREEA